MPVDSFFPSCLLGLFGSTMTEVIGLRGRPWEVSLQVTPKSVLSPTPPDARAK